MVKFYTFSKISLSNAEFHTESDGEDRTFVSSGGVELWCFESCYFGQNWSFLPSNGIVNVRCLSNVEFDAESNGAVYFVASSPHTMVKWGGEIAREGYRPDILPSLVSHAWYTCDLGP